MDDRFKFICGVDVSYYSDDGDDKDVIVWFEPDSVTKYGEVGFDFDIIKNELKKLNLSQHEFDTAIDFIYSNYETSIQDWCVADPKHLLQCTGFNDKNGTLIFDNDILEIVNVSKTIRYVSPVVFDKKLGAFMVWGNEEKTYGNIIGALFEGDDDGNKEFEITVIGNKCKTELVKNETLEKN